MKLYEQWLRDGDGRTLAEFVAARRAWAKQERQQRKVFGMQLARLRELQQSPNGWPMAGLQAMSEQQLIRHYPVHRSSGLGSPLGAILEGILGPQH